MAIHTVVNINKLADNRMVSKELASEYQKLNPPKKGENDL